MMKMRAPTSNACAATYGNSSAPDTDLLSASSASEEWRVVCGHFDRQYRCGCQGRCKFLVAVYKQVLAEQLA